MQHQVFFFFFYLQCVSKLKGRVYLFIYLFIFFIGLPKLRQLVKLALYTWSSPSYLDVCREIAAHFQANRARQRRLV